MKNELQTLRLFSPLFPHIYAVLHQPPPAELEKLQLCGAERCVGKAHPQVARAVPQLDHVVLCLDNDEAGLNAASRIHRTLQKRGFENVAYDISAHKNWNDELQAAYMQKQSMTAIKIV